MNEKKDPNVQIIKNATRDDVQPGDHLVWVSRRAAGDATTTVRREGIAHHIDSDLDGDWRTESGRWLTDGEGEGITLTIRRAVKELPVKPGVVIVVNDGHDYITAMSGGETYRAREAILIGENQWYAAWRSDEGVLIYVTPERIDAGTWKVGNR